MNKTPPKFELIYRLKSHVFALSLCLIGAEAFAEYRVSAYADSPGYEQIINADYAAASQAIPSYSPGAPAFALSTNRCVSEILSEALDDALASCNRALRKMPKQLIPLGAQSMKDRNATRSDLLSNRGVVLALKGEFVEAEADFALAVKLDEGNANASKNLAFLQTMKISQR